MVSTLFLSTLTTSLLALYASAEDASADDIHGELLQDYEGLPAEFQHAISAQTSALSREDYGHGYTPRTPLEKRSLADIWCILLGDCNNSGSSNSDSNPTTTTTSSAATPYYTTVTTTTNFALYSNNFCYVGDLGYVYLSTESSCRSACAAKSECSSYTFFGGTCSLSSNLAISCMTSYSGASCGIRSTTCASLNVGWLTKYYCSDVTCSTSSNFWVTPSQTAKSHWRRRALDGHKKPDHSSTVSCRNRETACLVDDEEEIFECKNLLTSTDSCGACNNDCTRTHGNNARCVRGVCLSANDDL